MPLAVDQYLQQWEECKERGEQVTPRDLCPDWPEGQAELARLIGLLEACDRLLVEATTPAAPGGGEAPVVVAGYEVRGELGRGGMGVVYRVWDPVLRREAALKMLRPGGLAALPDEADRLARRFQQEAQVLAKLKHEHIVPVFEARVDNGRPYFVMACVPEGSLAARLPEMTAAGPKVIVPFMEKVARAVQHAHSQGILHRDLKPANILLQWRAGEKPPPVPWVTDFGLAKLLSAAVDPETVTIDTAQGIIPDASRLTAPGVHPGTPAYMAPEQFEPAFGAVGPATDVWALGVILYEVLTGQKPFREASREELRTAVCGQAPARPRALQPMLDRRLERVVLRCLEKEPDRRFPSAAALADALARWRRRRGLVKGLAAVLTGVALVLGLGWLVARERDPERRYQRRVEPLLRQLERGETVELIQPGGEPPAYRIRCGEGITKARMTEEGFRMSAPTLGIVEFLPRVPIPHYRIEAEMRHDLPSAPTQHVTGVGVTFTGRHVQARAGVHHVVADVAFDDWKVVPAGQARGVDQPSCRAQIELRWFLDTPPDGEMTYRHRELYPPNRYAHFPPPKEKGNKPWRSLAVNVAPEGATAFWGENPSLTMGPLRRSDFPLFASRLQDQQVSVRDTDLGPLDEGRVGVMVFATQCTIRKLRVIPRFPTDQP